MYIYEKFKKNMFEKDRCDENLNNCIDNIKDFLIETYPTNEITIHYLVLELLKNNEVSNKLSTCLTTTSLAAIETSLMKYMTDHSIDAVKPGRDIPFSNEFDKLFIDADNERQARNGDKVSCDDVILAILKDDSQENKIGKVFRRAGLTYSMYNEKIKQKSTASVDPGNPFGDQPTRRIIIQLGPNDDPQEVMQSISNAGIGIPGNKKLPKTKHPNIDAYCTNLNDLVDLDKLDKIIGRENETEEIIRILGRRKKNNAIIVGPDGCGKTAVCENIARKIKEKQVPDFLLDKEVIALDMTALIAGTTLRGMFEERVKGVLNEIKTFGNYILFIDNIGTVLNDKGKNDYDISAMLSNSLENGELQVIGTSDFKSYRSTFDKNPSLSRRFQKIIIESPSKEESVNILKGIKEYYEDFHKVKFDDKIIEMCVELAARYIPERNLPDSAIDIMDEAGATISINNKQNSEIKTIKEQISTIQEQINNAKKEEDFVKVDELVKQLRTKNIILSARQKKLEEKHPENYTPITENIILELISKKTNIPTNNLSIDDKKKIATINDRLKMEVIGQDDAIDTICRAIKRNSIGFSSNKCLCSHMLIGKSGVGKTLIAKKLAKEMFGSEDALIRFDMSEYPDKTAVNKLIGSNPGYVGYEDGGILTEKIKNRKYCVLLLDEIEKADDDVYNIFLQILDEGMLTDNSGMKVDFSNVIVLFTSNVGAKSANDFSKGIAINEDESKNSKRIFEKELKNKFPPEFLNRLNSVIYFNNLTNDDLKKIIDIELHKSIEKIMKIGYDIILNDKENIINFLLDKIKNEKDFGARPVVRIIQTQLEDTLTDIILEKDCPKNTVFNVEAPNLIPVLTTKVLTTNDKQLFEYENDKLIINAL